jgi:hypothetical protein
MKKFLLIGILILISSCTSDDVTTNSLNDCKCGEVVRYHYDELALPPIEPAYIVVKNDCNNIKQTFSYTNIGRDKFLSAINSNRYCHWANW